MITTCTIDGCDSKTVGRGWCRKHYNRWYKTGDPEKTKRILGDKDARFDSYVELIPETSCHWWSGAPGASGYGVICADGVNHVAHRYAYERAKGKIPDGLIVRHQCHNRLCVNPDHLLTGTRADNARDCVDANRQARGEGAFAAKLNNEDVMAIRLDGDTNAALARRFGVDASTISNIRTRRTWRHVL